MGPDVLDSVHRVLGGQAVLTCTTTNTHTHKHNLLVNDRCLQGGGGGGGRRKNNDTDSVLHWCWSAPWPLTSVCRRLGGVARSCWPCRPVSWSPPSPPGTGWAHLRRAAQQPARWIIDVRFKILKLYLSLAHRLCSEMWEWQCYAEIVQTAKDKKTNSTILTGRKQQEQTRITLCTTVFFAITHPKVCWHCSSGDGQ